MCPYAYIITEELRRADGLGRAELPHGRVVLGLVAGGAVPADGGAAVGVGGVGGVRVAVRLEHGAHRARRLRLNALPAAIAPALPVRRSATAVRLVSATETIKMVNYTKHEPDARN